MSSEQLWDLLDATNEFTAEIRKVRVDTPIKDVSPSDKL